MALSSLPGASEGFTGSSSATSGGNPFIGARGPLTFNFGGSRFGIGEAAILIAALVGAALILKR